MPVPNPSELAAEVLQGEASAVPPDLAADLGRQVTSEESSLAGWVNQRDLGPPGMRDLGTRFKIAAADTYKEKIAAFTEAFPNGDLVKDPVAGELLFRADPSQPYAKVDAGMLEAIEPLGDLIDFAAADIGAISGELLLAMRSRGVSLVKLLGKLFTGASTGEYAQEFGEHLGGFQKETFGEIGERGTIKGLMGIAGYGAGRAIQGGVNVVRGAGALTEVPGAHEAMRVAEKHGIPPLLPTQVSDHPIVQKLGGQAAAVLPTIERHIGAQNKAITEKIAGLRDTASATDFIRTLGALGQRERDRILGRVLRGETPGSEAGKALTEGVADYSVRSKAVVDGLYRNARDIERPQFNFTPIYDAIDDLGTGKPALGFKPEPVTKQVQTGILDASGRPIAREVIEQGEREVIQGRKPLAPEIRAVAEKLQKIDPQAPDIVVDGEIKTQTDALLALRRQLWDLKTPAAGEPVREEHALAASLYNAITKVLDNPRNGNTVFVEAWDAARKAAAGRFDTLEKIIVVQAAKTETPAQLAAKLAQPRQVDNLKLLRAVAPNEKFAKFQDFFKTELIEKADDLTDRLAQFDKETLDMLLSPAEQGAFRVIGSQISRLNAIGIREVTERNSTVISAVRDAVIRKDTARTDDLFGLMMKSGGREGEFGKAMRGALLEDIWAGVRAIPKGEGDERVMRTLLSGKIDELRASNAWRFLTAADRETIKDMRLLKSFVDVGADTGTSIQAAEAVAGARRFSAAAIETILHHIGVGRFMVSDFGRKMLVGGGVEKIELPTLKVISAALGTALADYEKETKKAAP